MSMPRSRIGLPYLALSELQIRRVLRRLQRVALGINQIQAGILSAHLSTQEQVHVEGEVVALERRAIDVGDPANAVADNSRRLIQRSSLCETTSALEVEAQQRHDRLTDREAAAREDDEHALALFHEPVHLAADFT